MAWFPLSQKKLAPRHRPHIRQIVKFKYEGYFKNSVSPMDRRLLQTQQPPSNPEHKKPSIRDWFNSLDSVSDAFRALGRLVLIAIQGLWMCLRIVFDVLVLVFGFISSRS